MNKVKKDLQNRKNLVKNNKLLTKILFNNRILALSTRTKIIDTHNKQLNLGSFKAKNKGMKTPRGYVTNIRNYCQVTGRARGVLPTWKVSRIVFKANADLGLIPGIRSASW